MSYRKKGIKTGITHRLNKYRQTLEDQIVQNIINQNQQHNYSALRNESSLNGNQYPNLLSSNMSKTKENYECKFDLIIRIVNK